MSRTEQEVLRIAFKTLSLDEDDSDVVQALPIGYVGVIRDFLGTNPYDDHWIIERGMPSDPHFGVVTCMEEGCFCDLPLEGNPKLEDRGHSMGVGSLDVYKRHIRTHPTHTQARNLRQKSIMERHSQEDLKRAATSPSSLQSSAKRPHSALDEFEENSKRSRSALDFLEEPTSLDAASPAFAAGPLAGPSRLPMVAYNGRYGVNDTTLSISQRRKLLVDEYSHLKTKVMGSTVLQRKILYTRLNELSRSINNPTVPEPPLRSASLLAFCSELPTKFGSFDRPPAGYATVSSSSLSSSYAAASVPGTYPVASSSAASSFLLSAAPAATPSPSASQAGMSVFQRYQAQAAKRANDFARGTLDLARAAPANMFALASELARGVPGAAYRAAFPYDEDVADIEGHVPYGGRPVVQGREVELKEFFEEALNDFADDRLTQASMEKLHLKDIKQTLPHMRVTLMPHQIIGVSWMVSQEADDKYCGGILADAMGLGKTVQTIALILANRSEDRKKKSNLILAPLALLEQWKDEIELKTDGSLDVLIYHGSKKISDRKVILSYDVVLTTLSTLAQEFPKPEKIKKPKLDSDGEEIEPAKGVKTRKKYGPLAEIEWFRIIIDEAQNIRNKNTLASKAVSELEGDYRWALTGTPITNGLDDLYGLFRFICAPKFSDWDNFRDHISQPAKRNPDLAAKRAQVVLKTCLLRRTKDSKIDGKPILQLGLKTIELEQIDFTKEERLIYTCIQARAQVRFNKFLKAGTVLKNYACILTMLLRLRQLCNHPQLLTRVKGEGFNPGDLVLEGDPDEKEGSGKAKAELSDEEELQRATQLAGQAWVDRVRKKFLERQEAMQAAEAQDEDAEVDEHDCPICFEPVNQAVITVCCFQEFCAACIDELGPAGPESPPDEKSCPICRQRITPAKLFKSSIFEPPTDEEDVEVEPFPRVQLDLNDDDDDDDELPDATQIGKVRRNKLTVLDSDDEDFLPVKKDVKGKGRALRSPSPSYDFERGLGENDVIPSTKMNRMMALIEHWQEESPDDKIIIFSQFVKFIDMLNILLNKKGIRHKRYDGGMSRQARVDAVKQFENDNKTKVMIISLKCGGVGLNLTRANKVINMDLAWNTATEDQALDRVHRIGQTKPVEVHRLVIEDTVEQRILQLQERKRLVADATLGEGSGQKLGRLSVRDLARLFGVNHQGEEE